MKIDPSIPNTALVQKLQLDADVAGQNPLAAAKHHRCDEQLKLVDQPGPDRLCSQVRARYRNIVRQLSLQVANRLSVEFRSRRVFGVGTVSSDLE